MFIYIDFLLGLFAVFYSFCLLLSKNPVHSVLYLILVFINISFLFIKYSLEFLGIFLIIIYIGAISVLFLFVIMMLKLKQNVKISNLYSSIIIIFFFIQLYSVIPFDFIENSYLQNNLYEFVDTFSNVNIFGQLLYSYFFSFIIIVGIVLLLALISSVILTIPINKQKDTNKIYQQLSRKPKIIFFKNII